MSDDRLNSIESRLMEAVAKQDFLLDTVLQLGKKLDATTSEMKSNYVAIAAMFKEISAHPKA
jgi:hypothetical protein